MMGDPKLQLGAEGCHARWLLASASVQFTSKGKAHPGFTQAFGVVALVSVLLAGPVFADEGTKAPERSFDEVPIIESDRDHWSFQPITDPRLPSVRRTDWPANGIDYFILAAQEAADLSPAAEAERSVLLRRLKLDLLGLPPTSDEIAAFESDVSDDAYEKLVDAYLTSPRFGERWAQGWLDLARFAETDGFEHDRVRRDAWKYRDWVIQGLNDDLPYDRFVYQQLAGDMDADDHQQIATMFCLAGPDMPDLNDQELRRHDRLNELTSTVGSVLLGLQFHCAQCHDHKYDPISQADFYRLRAVFEPSVPELSRDKPWNVFASDLASTLPRFYFRGDLQQPGPIVQAAFPRIATRAKSEIQYCQTEHARAELAEWLFQENNPLTSRVIVNRLWQSHFGRGLFENASDVGTAAGGPTHPELLDWLATELRRNHWSLKNLHRQIVLSSTYRQSSFAREQDASWRNRIQADPRNSFYTRFPRHRIEAETIRDSMLAVAGLLDFRSGGEGVMPPLPSELLGTLLKGQWKSSEEVADHWRRSVYVFARRNLRYPIFESFDRPDAGASCPKRDLSTTAIQSLQMLNSELSMECSLRLERRILDGTTNPSSLHPPGQVVSIDEQIRRLFEYALARKPVTAELEMMRTFLGGTGSPGDDNLRAACLAIFNSSEFIYID